MAIRITDAFKPGYTRVPLGEIAKSQPPGGTGKVGSAILNQAQAEVRGMKSVAVPTAPSILVQPVAVSVTEPATAVFSVTAQGESISYQWKRNGVVLSGATSATYTLATTSNAVDNGGSYTCVVSNAGGSVTSSAALLTVASSLAWPTGVEQIGSLASNSGADGTMSASSEYSASYAAWKAADGNVNTDWSSAAGDSQKWIQFQFTTRRVISRYRLAVGSSPSSEDIRNWTLSGSNDGSSWTVLDTRTRGFWQANEIADYDVASPGNYTHYRLTGTSAASLVAVWRWGLYALTDQIGTLVSSSNANGTITASSEYNATYNAIRAVDRLGGSTRWNNASDQWPCWLKFVFNTAKIVSQYRIYQDGDWGTQSLRAWKLQGSNDGSVWTDLDTVTRGAWAADETMVRKLAAPAQFSQFRLLITSSGHASWVVVQEWYLDG